MTVDYKRFEPFEKSIGIIFQNKDFLVQAFTHRSWLNERKNWPLGHNERMEFLGDAVLELAVTENLFEKYPDKTEGELTSYRSALVNTTALYAAASALQMNDFILLSKGEAKDTGRARQYLLANALEALIGAIYLDRGYEKAKEFISEHLFRKIDEVVEQGLFRDAKSLLQEKAQELLSVTPVYQTLKEVGPDHDKRFTVGVFLGDVIAARGEGNSKQEAEQEAAKRGLESKGW